MRVNSDSQVLFDEIIDPIREVVIHGGDISESQFQGIISGKTYNCMGKQIFAGEELNKILLQGSVQFLEKMAGVRSTFKPQTLNSILGINDTVADDSNLSADKFMGFVVGLSNNSGFYGDKPAVGIADRNLFKLLPFRMTDAQLTGDERAKYLLEKDDTAGTTGKWLYYGKRFESGPEVKVIYEDGSEVPINVTNPTQNILRYIEWTIKVDVDDLVEYFAANPDSIGRRVTSLGLISGFPAGPTEVHHTQLATKANIDQLPLDDAGSYSILRYRVYMK